MLPGFEATAPLGVFVPAKTPPALIARLHQEITRVLNSSEIKDKFFSAGVEVIAGTPAQLAARMMRDQATLGKLIREAGIRAD